MVQVLPYVPGFGEELAQALGQAGQTFGQHYLKNRQKKNDLSLLGKLKDQNISPEDLIALGSQLSPEAQNAYIPLVQQLLKTRGANSLEQNKMAQAQAAQQQENEGLQNQFNEVKDLIPYGGSVLVPGKSFLAGKPTTWDKILSPILSHLPLNRGGVEKRAELDAAGKLLADKIYVKYNKGVLSNAKLKFVLDDLSTGSQFSERENNGRYKALKVMSGLPENVSQEEFDKKAEEAKKFVEDYRKGKKSKYDDEFDLVRFKDASGQEYAIPPSQVEEAKKAHPDLKRVK